MHQDDLFFPLVNLDSQYFTPYFLSTDSNYDLGKGYLTENH